jgi:hypothetical protein
MSREQEIDKRPKVVYCQITSWVGRVEGAEHYYVELVQRCGDEKTLHHSLTLSEAERLNRRNPDKRWLPGEDIRYFFDINRAVRAAVAGYKTMFPGAIILVEGASSSFEPQPILDGPKEVMAAINKLVEQAEDIDWWEEDEKAMRVISEKWKTIWTPEFEDLSL